MGMMQYFLIMFILIGINYISEVNVDTEISKRKEQSKSLLKENIVREKLDEILEENVKPSRKRKVELLMRQAGIEMEYAELVIYSTFSGIIIGILVGKILNNALLGLIFVAIGANAPKQLMMIIRNRRLHALDEQIGTFLRVIIKRYESTDSFHKALESTAEELRGEEPIAAEVNKTLMELEITGDGEKALDNLADRTNNKYLKRFAAYYGVVATTGSSDSRIALLTESYNQYEENRQLNRNHKKKISEPVRVLKMFTAGVPIVAIFQSTQDPNYISFMTQTPLGKVGTAWIVLSMLGVIWIINNKIGGPLD